MFGEFIIIIIIITIIIKCKWV